MHELGQAGGALLRGALLGASARLSGALGAGCLGLFGAACAFTGCALGGRG
jgi:hypothetical protein